MAKYLTITLEISEANELKLEAIRASMNPKFTTKTAAEVLLNMRIEEEYRELKIAENE